MKVKELLEKLKDADPEANIGIEILDNIQGYGGGVSDACVTFDEVEIKDNWVTLVPWCKLIKIPRLEQDKPAPWIITERRDPAPFPSIPMPIPEP